MDISIGRAVVAGLLASLVLASAPVRAGEVRVAVASNFAAPMERIVASFQAESGHRVSVSTGSTGKFYAQIKNGAPFDVFVAADSATPQRLEEDGVTVRGSRFVYALGKLALWSAQPGVVDAKGAVLRSGYNKLAIAEPKLAPYGMAAKETLEKLGLWNGVQARLVRGENITQTYQFVASGNAELGLVALSQITREGKITAGSSWVVPPHLYRPIQQSAVQLSAAKDPLAAKAFLDFMRGKQAAAVMRSFGYELP
ncbi:MAG TPA: molybdate ABC transporter substrate-binding protein [Gallionella sp.]|nr:molybdate ABC transporter substrate-binding protein [Gallionella sp.]